MSIKSYKKSARAVEAYLKAIGKKVSYAQSLEVVARAHGAPNWNVLQGRVGDVAPAKEKATHPKHGPCRKCGTALDAEGWCMDETCPYHVWPQGVPEADLSDLPIATVEARYQVRRRLFVSARASSDDRVYDVQFDATPWFSQASDADIMALAAAGWGGSPEADDVARYFSDLDADVGTLFDYLTRVDVGFECYVDSAEAVAWLKQNRLAAVWAPILCEENGVTLSEAQEEEVRGMWDWVGPLGTACEHSFDTLEEAALDAVQALGLSEDACTPELSDPPPGARAEVGPVFLIGKPPLSPADLERYTEDNKKLEVVLEVPCELLGDGSEAVDDLNDYVSERITGSSADLVNIGYEVYHMTDAERIQHGGLDKHTVALRVRAHWEPSDF